MGVAGVGTGNLRKVKKANAETHVIINVHDGAMMAVCAGFLAFVLIQISPILWQSYNKKSIPPPRKGFVNYGG